MVQAVVTTDKKRISLYVDERTKELLEALAKIRARSLSNMIEIMCKEEIVRAKKSGEFERGNEINIDDIEV